MKIAIITSCFLPIIDGVTVSGFQRLKRLSKWGHEVILFCPDYSSLKADYPNWQDYTGDILPGVKVINLASNSFVGLDYEPNVNRNSYQTVLKKLAEFQPDVIHVDEPERLYVGFWRLAGVNYAKKVGIPCVSFFRTNFLDYLGDYFPLPQPILALIKFLLKQLIVWVYNSYDLTLVTSKITYPKIVDLGIKNARYGNLVGFDTESFQDSLCQTDFFQSQYGLSQVDPLVKVVFLGRLYPDKGWDFTLDAFKTVSQQIDLTKVAIIVAGDGPMREEIRSKLKTLAPHVYLLGRISPENVPALLMNCDLHVTTSEKETRGLTILEAFAAGIPVIAPCSGGVVENIDDGNNGYLYSPGDRYNFTNKLKLLVENSALRQQMGERAKISVQGYSWDRSIQNLVNIWQEEIEQKSMINEQQFSVNPEYN
ncbi:MAG: glycosyltransferase family 4 protein [Pleurocapsa sp. SU_5_0]|nr:glycosyltransferase family 4 protein [Pleurocapsa sp. SU_5_0]NJO98121.1 glycosyltransferase family 4 protein [Pleurocapsa sp. CRU_1_2]